MPNNWEERFGNKIKNALDDAANKTNNQLAEEMSSYLSFSALEIEEMFPEKVDLDNLADLIDKVNEAKEDNEKMNSILNNTQKYGKVMGSLLKKVLVK